MLKCVPCLLLNHVHNVWSKATALDGPLTNTLNLKPGEIKDTKGLCIWCHPMEKVPGVIYNSTHVSTLAVNRFPKHPIQVPVGRVKTVYLPN